MAAIINYDNMDYAFKDQKVFLIVVYHDDGITIIKRDGSYLDLNVSTQPQPPLPSMSINDSDA